MKKTFVLLIGVALLSLATTNSPMGIGPFTNPPPTNTVHVLPNMDTVSAPPSNLSLLIAVAVPALIAGLRSWVPKMPSWLLPIMAPAIGALMDWVMQLAGTPTNGVAMGALLGSAGVGLREIQDQVKQRMVKPPPTPPVDPQAPKP